MEQVLERYRNVKDRLNSFSKMYTLDFEMDLTIKTLIEQADQFEEWMSEPDYKHTEQDIKLLTSLTDVIEYFIDINL